MTAKVIGSLTVALIVITMGAFAIMGHRQVDYIPERSLMGNIRDKPLFDDKLMQKDYENGLLIVEEE